MERLKYKFEYYFSIDDFKQYKKRIKIIEGDILSPYFGLTQAKYKSLIKDIDCLIDTVALVKHFGLYEEFRKYNVESTKNVIEFCKLASIPLHYISTITVSGYGLVQIPENSIFDENSLYIGQKYKDNVYVRSKFEAEELIVNECKENNLIASIYRIGNLTNRFSDGKFQDNFKENAFYNRLSSIISLKCFPDSLLTQDFEFSPVDICANFIYNLMSNQKYNLNIYHLYNNNVITGNQLIELLKEAGININIVSVNNFEKKILDSKKTYFGITNYTNAINYSNNFEIRNGITTKILKNKKLVWPNIDLNYIIKLINYFN